VAITAGVPAATLSVKPRWSPAIGMWPFLGDRPSGSKPHERERQTVDGERIGAA